MRTKVLLMPLMLISAIVLLIWLVKPAFSEMMKNRADLKKEQEKLVDIIQKSDAADSLVQEMKTKDQQVTTVTNYLPDTKREEEIIDNLNYIAFNEGLSIIRLTVDESKRSQVESVTYTTSPSGEIVQNITLAQNENRKVDVGMGVVGSYDKVKNFIDKVFKLKRYNGVESLNIKRVFSLDANAPTEDKLQAEFVFDFSYREKMKSIEDFSGSVFQNGSFDLSAVNRISDLTSVDVLKLKIDSAGRTNPFLP